MSRQRLYFSKPDLVKKPEGFPSGVFIETEEEVVQIDIQLLGAMVRAWEEHEKRDIRTYMHEDGFKYRNEK